jgi:macrolide transport system ATP-binding/permease protein
MRSGNHRPPVLARWLLRALAPRRAYDELAGDLHEMFALRAERAGPAAARRWYWRQVVRAYFDLDPVRRPVVSRSMAGDPLMLTLAKDARYAVRMLRKQPSFTIVAILMLALGIGANATVFSWINSVLLTPLPGAERQGELLHLSYTFRGEPLASFSYPEYRDIREATKTLTGVAARDEVSVGIVIDREAEHVWADIVTANFFEVLEVRPLRGRVLRPSDDDPGADLVAVIGHDYWMARFAGSDDVIGRRVQINAQPFTIVGIAPDGFQGGSTGLQFDLWIPVGTQPLVMPPGNRLESRGSRWLFPVARRAPGVSTEQVRAELTAILSQMRQSYPGYDDWGITALPLSESPTGAVSVLRRVLLVLMATAIIVLLIACANLAGLLAARAAARQREMAIRLSVGANRGRLVQQLLVEGVILAAAGTAAALLALQWTSGLLMGFAPPSELPIRLDVAIDGRVVTVTAAAALGTVLLFALVPALFTTATDLSASLRDGGASGRTFARSRLRRGLVAAQVALSITLLVGAGLCVRSLWVARVATPGFVADNVVVGWIDLLAANYTADEGREYYSRVLDRVRALPGVQSASFGSRIPLGFIGGSSSNLTIDGYQPADNERVIAGVNRVGPDYFRTLQIPLVAGRDIAESDVRGQQLVAVITDAMARRFWPAGNALGGRFFFGRPVEGQAPDYITVVGVARDIKQRTMTEAPQNAVYLPVRQFFAADTILHVRTAADPSLLAGELQRVVRAMDPRVPFYNVSLLKDHTAAATFQQQLAANLLVVFGGLALMLAAIGSYGVLSFLVGQRRREIGIRLAVGASRASVFALVAVSGAKLVGIGAAIGFMLSVGVGIGLGSLLIGVQPLDPLTYLVVLALMGSVALIACALPARRAASINPIATLRED